MDVITAELLDKKYLYPGFGQDSAQWAAAKLVSVYQRLLSVHSDAFDYEGNTASLCRHLAHISKCLRLLEISHLAPKLQDLTDKSRALRIISALDDKISAKYKVPMAARRVRMVMKKEDQKGKTLKPKPRPPAAQEETVSHERIKSYYPETPETQKHMIPSGRQLQRTPVAQEKNDTGEPVICRYESFVSSTSKSERVTDILSIDEGAATIPNYKERVFSIASNNENLITSNSIGPSPITSTKETPASLSIANSLSTPSVTSSNENQAAITSKDRTLITSNNYEVASSSNERVTPTINNNDRVSPITSNNERVAPVTCSNEREAPITSNKDRASPIITNNDRVAPITSNTERLSLIISNDERVAAITNNSESLAITSNNEKVTLIISNNDKVALITSNNERMAPITSNNESPAITSNNESLTITTSDNESLSFFSSNDRGLTSNRDSLITSNICSSAFTINCNERSDSSNSDAFNTSKTGNKNMSLPKDTDVTYFVPTNNKPWNESNFDGKGIKSDASMLKDTAIEMASDTFILSKIKNETFFTSDSDESLEIFPRKHKALRKADLHSEAKKNSECALGDEFIAHTKALNKSKRIEKSHDDADVQVEVFGASADYFGNAEVKLNFTSPQQENNKKIGDTVTVESDDSNEGKLSNKETRGLESNGGSRKIGETNVKVKSKKCSDIDENSKDNLKRQEVRLRDQPMKNSHKSNEMALEICYEEEEKENIIVRKDEKLKGQTKKKAQVKPLQEVLQRSKCDKEIATEKTNRIKEILDDRSEVERRGAERKGQRIMGKESSVDAPTDIFLKSNCNQARNVKIDTEDLKSSMADDIRKEAVKSKGRQGAVNKMSLSDNETETEGDKAVQGVKLVTRKLHTTETGDVKMKAAKLRERRQRTNHKKSFSEDEMETEDTKAAKGVKLGNERVKDTVANDVEIKAVKSRGRRLRAVLKLSSDDEVEIDAKAAESVKLGTEGLKNTVAHVLEKKNVKRRGRKQRQVLKFSSGDEMETDARVAEKVEIDIEGHKRKVIDDAEVKVVKLRGRRQRKILMSSSDETETEEAKMNVETSKGIKFKTEKLENIMAHGMEKKAAKSRGRKERAFIDKFSSDDGVEIEDAKGAQGVKLALIGLKNTMSDDIKEKALNSKVRHGAVHKSFSDNKTKMKGAKVAEAVKLGTEELKNTLVDDREINSREKRQRTVLKNFSSNDEMEIEDTKAVYGIKLDTEEQENTMVHTCDLEKKGVKSKGRRQKVIPQKSLSHDKTEAEDAKINVTAAEIKIETEKLKNIMARNMEVKGVRLRARRQWDACKKLPNDNEVEMEATKISVTVAKGLTLDAADLESIVACDIKNEAVKSKGGQKAVNKKFLSDDGTETQDMKMRVAAAESLKIDNGNLESTGAYDIKKKAVKSKGKWKAIHKTSPSAAEAKMNGTYVSVKAAKSVRSDLGDLRSTTAHDVEKKAMKSKGGRRRIFKFSSDEGAEMQDAKMNVTTLKSDNDKVKGKDGKGKGKSEEKNEEEPCVEVTRGRRCKSRARAAIQAMLNDSYA